MAAFSNFSNLVLLVLVAAIGIMVEIVEGGSCSQAMGHCGGAGDCDQRCKAQHQGGQGSCNLNLCACYYSCGPSPAPVGGPKRNCDNGLGLCTLQCGNDCCNSKCASKFNQGIGFCNNNTGTSLCNCQYVC